MNTNISLSQILGMVRTIAAEIVFFGLLLAIAAKVAAMYGFRVPMLPAVDHVTLAYVCGAYWLLRK